jgi:hypothetical protein
MPSNPVEFSRVLREVQPLMHAAVERILSTYAMMRNLSEKDIEGLRADVITFLSKHEDLDEGRMAVEGIRYLRQRTRRG